jgi:hypothetical protein
VPPIGAVGDPAGFLRPPWAEQDGDPRIHPPIDDLVGPPERDGVETRPRPIEHGHAGVGSDGEEPPEDPPFTSGEHPGRVVAASGEQGGPVQQLDSATSSARPDEVIADGDVPGDLAPTDGRQASADAAGGAPTVHALPCQLDPVIAAPILTDQGRDERLVVREEDELTACAGHLEDRPPGTCPSGSSTLPIPSRPRGGPHHLRTKDGSAGRCGPGAPPHERTTSPRVTTRSAVVTTSPLWSTTRTAVPAAARPRR